MTPGKIKQLRKLLHRSQPAFAAIMSVHPITVSRWERGEMVPRAKEIEKLDRLWAFVTKQDEAQG